MLLGFCYCSVSADPVRSNALSSSSAVFDHHIATLELLTALRLLFMPLNRPTGNLGTDFQRFLDCLEAIPSNAGLHLPPYKPTRPRCRAVDVDCQYKTLHDSS